VKARKSRQSTPKTIKTAKIAKNKKLFSSKETCFAGDLVVFNILERYLIGMEELTAKEKKILDFVTDFSKKNGYSPSVRDIQIGLSIKSTSTVHAYVERLSEKGYIDKSSGKSRSLRTNDPTPSPKTYARIPLVGKVTAGQPILAIENIEGYLDFPLVKRSLRESPSSLFALRVSGESMINAGILDGDILVVQKEPIAENGEIVVAMVEDSATVKTYYKEHGHFRLQPQNPTMEPIIVNECTIVGKVISVMRFYN
jgi:repressor LexA